MWKPPERIKHPLPEARWPDMEEARGARLFSPLELGPLELRERTWVPAMVPWRATEEGFVTDDVLDWYRRFAEGQAGALVVEATGIRDVPSGPLLRIGHDRFLPGLRRLVETVREASGGRTRLLIQVIDFLTIRRRPPAEKYFGRYLEISDRHRRAVGLTGDGPEAEAAVRRALLELPRNQLEAVLTSRELEALDYGYRERVTDLHLPHVRELPAVLPSLFADAASRAEQAGFDGVELHFAHAYTMASFLSALNTREDGYGGTLEGRARLPLEVLEAVRAKVGEGFAVGCRYLTEDCLDGGSTVDDAAYFGTAFARAGMDFLSLSRGGKFEDAKQPKVGRAAYPYTGPSGYECMPTVISDAAGPFGRNREPAAHIRRAIRAAGFATPTVVAGGIATFDQAEGLLRDGVADVVAAARQSLADPDWFRKMRRGRGREVRRCIYTNYCEGLDQMHKQVTCQLWDREALDEPGIPLSHDGKRRLVPPTWKP
ncbi:MAG: NADH:flavin oxidoreductase [Holophagales bacterium]|nr:NADH:flavin oxidoreductase [Holophagales bacterium]